MEKLVIVWPASHQLRVEEAWFSTRLPPKISTVFGKKSEKSAIFPLLFPNAVDI